MLFRFSLYGFLKNQRYFEAFLVLAFMEKGLDFFHIGLLVAVRELAVNALEIPSGAIADLRGRRLVMILSFASYVVSFVVLGLADHFTALAGAMVLFGIGDAFRTGTHKAMIFEWLRLEGRVDERVRVYGYTRSWSKFGSAVSVLIAAIIVLVTDRYTDIFFVAVVPYVLAIINFLGYPQTLDGARSDGASMRSVFRHMLETMRESMRRPQLRRLVAESMGFDGVFAAVKDYVQPVLEALAISMAAAFIATEEWSDVQRTALLVGPVYFVLFVLSGLASRNAHRVPAALGGEERAARVLWIGAAVVFAAMLVAGYVDRPALMVVTFVAIFVMHNLWRPVLISRFDRHGKAEHGASLLSIENQGARAATMIVAPVLGWAIDRVGETGPGGTYWPIGALGLAAALFFVATGHRRRSTNAIDPPSVS